MTQQAAAQAERSPRARFAQLWDALSDVLGVPATATLLRRSVKRAAARAPESTQLVIAREGLDYRYQVPSSWGEAGGDGSRALQAVLEELRPLLFDLTGPLLVRRLDEIAEAPPGASARQEGGK